jgi:hypothetical protein
MPEAFDDFLGLAERDFSRHRLVVLHGCSGSGKSTAIRWLLDEHPDFRRRNCFMVESHRGEGEILSVSSVPGAPRLVAIDEITRPGELALVARVLAGGAVLLVASHLPPAWFVPFRLFGRVSIFTTDTDGTKIARHLERIGAPASPRAVELFVRRFGANYTDVAIIRERCPAPSFDVSFARFERFSRIDHHGP